MVAHGPGGDRTIPVDDFFTGFLETALEPTEILTEIRVPKAAGAGWSFQKFNRRAQDWAIVGVALVRNGTTGIGLVNMGPRPVRAAAAEAALVGGASTAEAAALADEGTEPSADLNASVDYRRHLARVLVQRALDAAT
jgi:carbon-monoxide dehydrogenase medium subunit